MSFPRNSDVSRHMSRKPHLSIVPRPEPTSPADRASTDLRSLSEDLSAAVNSAQSPSRPGDDQ